MMSKAILYRGDQGDAFSKSNAVYSNVQLALSKLARREGRDIQPNFDPFVRTSPRRGTTYRSAHSVVAMGVTAHKHLRDVMSASVIYLNPSKTPLLEDPQVAQMINCVGGGQPMARVCFLGPRAKHASIFLSQCKIACYELPPVDLTGPVPNSMDRSRLTIVNHSDDDRLSRAIIARFLECTAFTIDAFGLNGPDHNRVRYLSDDEISERTSSVHIHIGTSRQGGERIRIGDSWQSRVPVLYFDYEDQYNFEAQKQGIQDNRNVLLCRSYDQACEFIALLLDTPNLYRQLVTNGRASAAPSAQSWDNLARDLAA